MNERSDAVESVFLGIGANLGDRRAAIDEAVARIDRIDDVRVVRLSTVRETEPVGGPTQGRYLNAACEIATRLSPHELLDHLLAIESAMGRVRDVRFGPRTIDLDILVFGDRRIADSRLEVPHARMCERAFVLEPLAEIAPDRRHPVAGGSFAELWDAWRRDRARGIPDAELDAGGGHEDDSAS